MLFGAILSNWLKGRFTNVQLGLAATGLVASGVLVLPWSSTLTMACLFTFLIGFGMLIIQINGQMLLQTIAPEMRGRLLGISQTLTAAPPFWLRPLLVYWWSSST